MQFAVVFLGFYTCAVVQIVAKWEFLYSACTAAVFSDFQLAL